ncbi:MAG: TIR domain-containing protein [Sphaerochaetaceae bacterium]|nr:TIR domain-containing protein [Sphaerochaetaceae bacterium]
MYIQNYVKRTVFISHYKDDRAEVDEFINRFSNVFIPKVLGANDNDDFINSSDTNYVMSQIRKKYLQNSTVTIVLIGSCTHSRRYIDWEIKSSLQQGENIPNGLLGILLPSQGSSAYFPPRLSENWNKDELNCYARCRVYPSSDEQLRAWIEDAYQARKERIKFIRNTNDIMKYNSKCLVCRRTH